MFARYWEKFLKVAYTTTGGWDLVSESLIYISVTVLLRCLPRLLLYDCWCSLGMVVWYLKSKSLCKSDCFAISGLISDSLSDFRQRKTSPLSNDIWDSMGLSLKMRGYTVFQNHWKCLFNITSAARYVYILSGRKMPKTLSLASFVKTWSLRSKSVTRYASFEIGQKLVEIEAPK